MVVNLVSLFLSKYLGVKPNIIGSIKGIAEATSSVLNVFSGWISDKFKGQKSLEGIGYGN